MPKRPATPSHDKKGEAYCSLSQLFATYSSVVRSVKLRPAVVLTAIGICLPFLTTSSVHTRSWPASLQAPVARIATVDLSGSDKTLRSLSSATGFCSTGRRAGRTTGSHGHLLFRLGRPSWLVLDDERSGSCADPALEGRRVLPVFAIDKSHDLWWTGRVVRIAHVVPHSPGYTLGPVVMTFPAFMGRLSPTWIYGGGDLWLYEWDNPGGVDLMRISATTGDVLQRLRVPKVWKPVLAYNDEGLWIAPSGQTSSPTSLYLVALGGVHATRCTISPTPGSRSGSSCPATTFGLRAAATPERSWRGVDAARSGGKAGLARSREREPRPGLRDAWRFWHGRRCS